MDSDFYNGADGYLDEEDIDGILRELIDALGFDLLRKRIDELEQLDNEKAGDKFLSRD